MEADRSQIEERMQFTRENYRMMRERFLKIVYWTKDTAQDGMKAPLPMDITVDLQSSFSSGTQPPLRYLTVTHSACATLEAQTISAATTNPFNEGATYGAYIDFAAAAFDLGALAGPGGGPSGASGGKGGG